jgi:F0F1-type ATP synthase membrane subunit b/b'
MFLAETSIQLVPDGTLLLHLLMVAVMVFVLNRTLLKPINRILSEREKQITGRLKEAEALSAESEEKRHRYVEDCGSSVGVDAPTRAAGSR